MKKRIVGAILALAAFAALAGCSRTCKAPGCDNDVFKKGYCEYHYLEKSLEDALGGLFD